MTEIAHLTLDVCTPEGKTWLLRITGLGGKYGVEGEFCRYVDRGGSRSGLTGWVEYLLADNAVYQSNEGRRRLGRRWWIVEDGAVREVQRDEALARFASPTG